MAQFGWHTLSDIDYRSLRFTVISALIAVILSWPHGVMAKDRVLFEKGKYNPLCEGIKKIIQLPENKGIITSRYIESENGPRRIIFPASNKDFQLPVWEDAKENEVKVRAPNNFKQIQAYNKPYALRKLTVQLFEKMPPSTFYMADFGLEKKNYVIGGTNLQIFMAENENSSLNDSFDHGAWGWALPFYYKDRFYFYVSGGPDIIIYRPEFVPPGPWIWMHDICVLMSKPTTSKEK